MEEGLSFTDIFILLFIFIPLILAYIFALVDIFRRVDLSGLAKVIWAFVVVLIPILGLIIYFMARPQMTEERQYRSQHARGLRTGERKYSRYR